MKFRKQEDLKLKNFTFSKKNKEAYRIVGIFRNNDSFNKLSFWPLLAER